MSITLNVLLVIGAPRLGGRGRGYWNKEPGRWIPASEVRDNLNVGVRDYLNASPLSCGIT